MTNLRPGAASDAQRAPATTRAVDLFEARIDASVAAITLLTP